MVCGNNLLPPLDVGSLKALTYLSCSINRLTSIDVSALTSLTALYCYSNLLTSLNLSGLTVLGTLDSRNNPSLSCIQVDNTVAANANSKWLKDATASYSLNCALGTTNYERTKTLTVFPNPTQAILNISATTNPDEIIISDLTGKNVLQQTQTSNQVNVTHLPKGMYILQAYLGKEKYTTKFVKD